MTPTHPMLATSQQSPSNHATTPAMLSNPRHHIPDHHTQPNNNNPLTTPALPAQTTQPNPYHCSTATNQRPPRLTQSTLDSSPPPSTTTPTTLQTTLYPDKANEHWGDPVNMELPPNYLRVLSRNVNTINPAENFLQWQAAAHALQAYSVGVACLQETNTQWSNPILQ